MKLEFDSRSCNESFARVAVAAFLTQLNPTLEEVADVKTAVSEAVTNAIIHGYEGKVEKITIHCRISGETLEVEVIDQGRGIPDVSLAMQPLFTTKAECDRAGMGFAFMEAFMDTLEVQSTVGEGTCVKMTKRIPREMDGTSDSYRTQISSGEQEKPAAAPDADKAENGER
jgi:stage II sporulation protein AB (anti-sigma F factor)